MPLSTLRCRQADKDLLGTGHFPTINIPGFLGGAPEDSPIHSLFFVSVKVPSQPGSHAPEEASGYCRVYCGPPLKKDTAWQISRNPAMLGPSTLGFLMQPCGSHPDRGPLPCMQSFCESCPHSVAASLPALCLSTAAATLGSLTAQGAAMDALLAALVAAHLQQCGSRAALVLLAVPHRSLPTTSTASLHLPACTPPSSPAVRPACACPACS